MITATITRPAKVSSTERKIPGVETPSATVNTVILENIVLYEIIDGQLDGKKDGAYGLTITGVSKFWCQYTELIQDNDLINNKWKIITAVPRRRKTFLLAERLS